MQIVIDIPKKWLNDMKKEEFINVDELCEIILHGTPLPAGHGRLIDADALKMDKKVCGDMHLSKDSLFVANKVIEQADTIIEADKAESEKE